MYQQSRVISTHLSNNRLNSDERSNRTIVVPSLIEGTLDDVITGEETVIEGEVGGKIIAGKGLKHFVFLKNSRVPAWIMDNHNHAFAFWHEAFWKGYITKGSLLVHIDQHTDLATPGNFPAWKHPEESNEILVEEYTNTDLTIADFIVPALSTGLISEALMVTGEDRDGAGIFRWENEKLIKKSIPVIARNEQSEGRGDPCCCMDLPACRQVASPHSQGQRHTSLIVDIDLDYFSQGFDDEKTLTTTKYWIEKADIITIATSPLFIEQEKALEYLRKLF